MAVSKIPFRSEKNSIAGFPANLAELLNLKIGIVGAGITGMSLVATLSHFGIKLYITDENPLKSQQLAEKFPQANVEIVPWQAHQLSDCDLLLTSPGIPPRSPIFPPHIPVYGDYELAWWLNEWEVFGIRKSWLAITGTNGKTTTVMMCESILQAAEYKAVSCGNIGVPILDILQNRPDVDYLLVEISSFQLHYAPGFCPDIGVLLNIAPDHIDWHGSFVDYVSAKYRILRGQIGIINADDYLTSQLLPAHKKISLTLGRPEHGQCGIDEAGYLVDNSGISLTQSVAGKEQELPCTIMPRDDISPSSPAGWMDALAAIAVGRSLDISPTIMAQALSHFVPAAHRGEIVYADSTRVWIDNSKATNPHATINAITDLQTMYPHYQQILLMGGQLKGADIGELVEIAAQYVSVVIVFGIDYEIIRDAFLQHAPNIMVICLSAREDNTQDDHTLTTIGNVLVDSPDDHRNQRHEHLLEYLIPQAEWNGAAVMKLATKIAFDQSQRYLPALILLAPAAASFDMFSGYAQRGELFQQSVHCLLSQ